MTEESENDRNLQAAGDLLGVHVTSGDPNITTTTQILRLIRALAERQHRLEFPLS